jgi:hypothetical protein
MTEEGVTEAGKIPRHNWRAHTRGYWKSRVFMYDIAAVCATKSKSTVPRCSRQQHLELRKCIRSVFVVSSRNPLQLTMAGVDANYAIQLVSDKEA